VLSGFKMVLSAGLVTCKLDHSHRILICNSYATDLYLSWSIEVWERLKLENLVEVGFLDVSAISGDSQLSVGARLKRLLRGKMSLEGLVARCYLPKEDHHLFMAFWRIKRMQIKSLFSLIKITAQIARAKTVEDFLSIRDFNSSALRSTHSTLAGKLGTVEYSPRKYILRISRYLLSYSLIKNLVNQIVNDSDYCQVTVGNGRLLNSAAALDGAQNISRLIIERGAMPGMLDSYSFSAHSMSERRNHVNLSWLSADKEIAERVAEEYLETRRIRDPISGVKWTSRQRSGLVPDFEEGKKVCVFYTTTELEFAVFFDASKPDEFSTQREALLALVECLDERKWKILVRRHPYSRALKSDPEGRNWDVFSKFANVSFIPPDSAIDSYALGARADLVAHFNSSIGPELIYQGHCPVITLGDNSWEPLNSNYLLRTKSRLRDFLSSDYPVRPKSDAYKWAYYSATFGEKFRIVEWKKFRGYIGGKHLLARQTRIKGADL